MTARNAHIGQVGERLKLTVTVLFVKIWRNEFSYTYLVKMRDQDGHSLSTFYQGRKWIPMRGQLVELSATVKEHDHYKGWCVTNIERITAKDMGAAPGFERVEPAPLPRSEELRLQQQINAQHAFTRMAKGPHSAH